MTVVVAVVAAGPGVGVGYRTGGRGIGLSWGESKSYDDGKQSGRDDKGKELFHVRLRSGFEEGVCAFDFAGNRLIH